MAGVITSWGPVLKAAALGRLRRLMTWMTSELPPWFVLFCYNNKWIWNELSMTSKPLNGHMFPFVLSKFPEVVWRMYLSWGGYQCIFWNHLPFPIFLAASQSFHKLMWSVLSPCIFQWTVTTSHVLHTLGELSTEVIWLCHSFVGCLLRSVLRVVLL